jgi:hypothetical protein
MTRNIPQQFVVLFPNGALLHCFRTSDYSESSAIVLSSVREREPLSIVVKYHIYLSLSHDHSPKKEFRNYFRRCLAYFSVTFRVCLIRYI